MNVFQRPVVFITFIYFVFFIPFSLYTKTLTLKQTHPSSAVSHDDILESFELDTLNGAKVNLEKVLTDNSAVMILFWATWCVHCRFDLAHLTHLYPALRKANIEVLAVSIDDKINEVKSYTEKVSIPFPILLDNEQTLRTKLGIQALPVAFILNKNRKVIDIIYGTDADLEERMNLWIK